MPVTMSGMASGVDSDTIINKLVEVERRPIVQLEIDKKRYSTRKEALKLLQNHLAEIDKRAKDLYGFRASFDDKKALSSDTGIIEAVSDKKAREGSTAVKVERMATNHKLSSDPVKIDEKLPAASFTISVNGEQATVRFKGGKIQGLKERIEEEASSLVSALLVKKSEGDAVLALESKVSGARGEIQISGDRDLLKQIGLVKGEKGEDLQRIALVFDKRYFASYAGDRVPENQDGSISVSQEGGTATVKGLLWQEYALPLAAQVQKDTVFEVNVAHSLQLKEEEPVPFRVELGPEERTVIKGIELKGYNVSRIRPADEQKAKKKLDTVLGVGIVADDKGKRTEKLYPFEKDSKGKQEIPIGRDFDGKSAVKIVLYCNEGTAEFADASIITPIKGKNVLDPKNTVTGADDAKLFVDGIEVTRPSNGPLNDVIEGVTLSIKGTSERAVTIDVRHDTAASIDKIKKFVESYNKYLEYNGQLVKAEKITKPGETGQGDRGIFVGDMTILRIESTLRRVVNGAYTGRAEKPVKMFPDMGVNTGEINADWESIKQGRLIVDEPKVEETLKSNPEGVREFFGSDTDGDNRIDNGMAFTVVNTLKPFTSSGKNIIASKMDLEDENIKMADERITRREEHVKKYEEKLRQKFSTMEKSISGAKSQENWLKQQMGAGQQK